MKIAPFKIFVLINLFISSLQILSEVVSAHEYAERTHNNIIEIIRTKNQLFLDNPDLFTKEISDAFGPIVDFKRISRNVMGKYAGNATPKQLEDFSKVFESSLLDTYASTLVEFKDEKFQRLVDISQKKIKEPPNWLIMSTTKRTGEKISQGFKDMGVPHFYRNRPVLEATKEKTLIRVQTIHTSKGAEADNTAIVFDTKGDVFGVTNNAKLAYVALTRARKRMFPRVVRPGLLGEKGGWAWISCLATFERMFPNVVVNFHKKRK